MSSSRFGNTGRAIMRSLTGLVAVFGLSLFGVAEVAAQNTGTVTGLVRDVVSLQTLAGAQVTIDDTPIGGLTNNTGRYLEDSHAGREGGIGYEHSQDIESCVEQEQHVRAPD